MRLQMESCKINSQRKKCVYNRETERKIQKDRGRDYAKQKEGGEYSGEEKMVMEVLAERTTLTKTKRAIEELDLGPRLVKVLLPKINS